MGNSLINLIVKILTLTIALYTLSSCQLLNQKVDGLSVFKPKKPIFIHLKGIQGFETSNRIYSKSDIKEKVNGITKDKEVKEVDFDLSSEILLVDIGKAHLYYVLKTTRKIGNMDLSDLAMPELNQDLKTTMYPNAEVFEVPGKPKTSIYYVPPISLPLHKVNVGESWEFKRMWLTAKNNVPVQINLKSTLTRILNCSESDKCADIAVTGFVNLPTADSTKLIFKSKLKGRILFSLKTGSVVWSSMYTDEDISYDKKTQYIKTCTTNHILKPQFASLKMSAKEKCDPLVKEPKLTWIPTDIKK